MPGASRLLHRTGHELTGVGVGRRLHAGQPDSAGVSRNRDRLALDGKIEQFMSKHQHDKNATPLWQYFQKVIGWAKATFPKYRKEMKSVDWGVRYNQFKDAELDTDKLEKHVAKLMMDDDVERKSGIYPYVLDGNERHLNIRAFSANMKREAFERQKGVCVKCKKKGGWQDQRGQLPDVV